MTLARPDRGLSDDLLRQAHEWDGPANPEVPTDEPWTLGRIWTAARVACSRVRLNPDSCREVDLVAAAASGVGLAVAIDPHVSWGDAVAAGQRDLWDAATTAREQNGRSGRGDKPRFHIYWLDEFLGYDRVPRVTRCETRIALAEVLSSLPARHLDTLLILAFTDSIEDAADAAGVGIHTFRCRTHAARRAALDLWFDHETPPPLSRLPTYRRGRDRTCPRGHLISGDNAVRETRQGRVIERCRACRSKERAT